jgi:hypothetical protein
MINNLIHTVLSQPDLFIMGMALTFAVFMILGLITFALVYIGNLLQSEILEKASDVTTILALISLVTIPITLTFIHSNSTTETKYGDWKEIYTNEINADVKLDILGSTSDLIAGKSINTNPKNLNLNLHAKLIVQKDDTTITKNVNLNKDSFIKNGTITENSKIVKVEYRTIEGYTKSAFDQTGDFIELKDKGEVRITIEPSEDEMKLNELLQ